MSHPRVFAVAMVRNEADVIESFVRYNLNLVDGILILNHNSSDRTADILQKMINEGLPLFLSHSTACEYDQKTFITRLVYEAFHTHHADWVFPLDADEFIVPTKNESRHPREILDELPQGAIYNIFWRTYFPHESDDPTELCVPKRLRYRTDQLPPGLDSARNKILIPRDLALGYRLHLSHGSHKLNNRRRVRRRIPHKDLDAFKLAHFPLRSADQTRSKIFIGWLNALARADRRPNENNHFHKLFDRLKAHGGEISVRDMQLLTATAYLHCDDLAQLPLDLEPTDLSFCKSLDLRYTTPGEIDVLRNVVDLAENVFTQYGKLRRESCSVSKSAATCVATTLKSIESLILGEILGTKPKSPLYRW
jgi:glycosyltransferase involved in cell wall biosynthesis